MSVRMEDHMRTITLAILAAVAITSSSPSWAHGDKPHPKCKKGYELNDQHRCVKKK